MHDPALDAHIPEMRGLNHTLRELMPNGADVSTLEKVRQIRAAEGSNEGPFAREKVEEARDRSIDGPGGDLRLHTLVPPAVEAVLLHIHGGGWTVGSPEMNDGENWRLAQTTNVAVVSVDYRLAPEHPYPAALDDCEAAALWLIQRASAEFGSDRLLIGGESAGAHLSAATLLRLRDRHAAVSQIQAANLVYGMFDLGFTPSLRRAGEAPPVLTTSNVSDFANYFLGDLPAEQRRSAEISPLYADLSGLPPALFSVGTLDPLLDDSLFMAARWQAAGNATELAIYPEAPHGFTAFPVAMGRAANQRAQRFIADAVSRARS